MLKNSSRAIALVTILTICCSIASAQTYDEPLRPQFHFTAARGWLNDPNGLVFYKGEYHLFFQHVPDSTRSIDAKTWGHAISHDLIHWKQLDEAINPIPLAAGKLAAAWSGTAVVDTDNTGGFAGASEKPIVAFWTATNLGQCLAYSNDAGRNFKMYSGNPVIPMDPPKKGDWDRDPDVFWYEPDRHWVMLYSITGKGFAFNTSDDLKHWTRQSLLPKMYECPSCFEIALDGDAANKKWIVWDASGKYFIGHFDGKEFTPESAPFLIDGSRNWYAAQTWNNAPDGRRISITWIRDGKFPGMPFNQQLGIPSELKLQTIPGAGPRLTKFPVREIEQLRYHQQQFENLSLEPGGANPPIRVNGNSLDIEAEFEPTGHSQIAFQIMGEELFWSDGRLSIGRASVAAPLNQGRFRLRLLVDRTSLETFVNDGAASMTTTMSPDSISKGIGLSCAGPPAKVISLRMWQMRSIWHDAEAR